MPQGSKWWWSRDGATLLPCPIAQQLGFDLWVISSNGAITRSLAGETFHRDLLPAATCRRLCASMQEFRGNTVLTFDTEAKGAIVLEHMDELNASIQRWLEKNLQYIDFVIPIEDALTSDPVQAMFCGPIPRMQQALAALAASSLNQDITVLRTEYRGPRSLHRGRAQPGMLQGPRPGAMGQLSRHPPRRGHGHW